MTDQAFIGIDVGTGSARAGVFDCTGALLGSARQAFPTWHEAGHVVEQSSEAIWAAVCVAVRAAVGASGVGPESIAGIGFDATCSLVVVDSQGQPLPVGPSGDAGRNIIVWMDHRAGAQVRAINQTGQPVLGYVGGAISPEMQTPKLLWLLENMPDTFAAAAHFFDLSDYLTWRATGSLARSVCTVTCKWTYMAHENRWDAGFFRAIGLGVLADEHFSRIGVEIVTAGTSLGRGLTATAAQALGLVPGTPVGAALIDAHAGGIGTVGAAEADAAVAPEVGRRLAYIYGTSACAMATTATPVFVPGVWGPYYSAMVPGMWLNEGGQSAAGAALDHLLMMHPAFASATQIAEKSGQNLLAWLEERTIGLSGSLAETARLAWRLHVVPEFHGNRAPFSDPEARAIITGLDLDSGIDSLIALYVAGLCGIAYGARQIADALKARMIPLDQIIVSGGAALSPLVRQLLADATGLEVCTAATLEPVLLGAAMLGAVAGAAFPTLSAAMAAMSRLGAKHQPATGALRAFHDAKFAVYTLLQDADRASRGVMVAV